MNEIIISVQEKEKNSEIKEEEEERKLSSEKEKIITHAKEEDYENGPVKASFTAY